ncbi:hypothetical protein [Brevibacillus halotolerans]|uniref:hypothetical protein n=1 Tax=Brevibacillus halotolerans TaxID=1507437 RepID=UPI0015EE4E50|nr:hypothetical protein [Brevibacillus halotolerans]MBA4535530.1 hypothetical protein [Brevibacillus halotolerans]
MKLILGDKTNETLRLIHNNLTNNNNEQVVWLEAQDIINELFIHDFINEKGVTLRWLYRETEISPEYTTGVLNFLFDTFNIEESFLKDFVERDREYASKEFYSYLIFALNQFTNVINPPWGGSMSGYCHSLLYQWRFVKQIDRNIKVPRSFFGLIKDAPDDLILGYNTIVSDDAFDGRYWKTGVSQNLLNDNHYLFYRRPRGNPFVITILDNKMWVQSLAQPICSTQVLKKVSFLCHTLMEHFHLRFAEILFFFDEQANLYTFGSIIPYMDVRKIPRANISEFIEAVCNTL